LFLLFLLIVVLRGQLGENKMKEKILITGGAGFIGSFLADELIERGYPVRIFDNLEPQVHTKGIPDYLNKKAEFIRGDVRNRDELEKALKGMEVVFHFAAAVGVAQSMYQIKRFVDTNVGGTGNLLDILANSKHSVRKLIVAASMTGYGEGTSSCPSCGIVYPGLRPEEQLKQGKWELTCPKCGGTVAPIPTPETKEQNPSTIYALTTLMKEKMCLTIGQTYGLPVVSLRFFNVYGPRQSLNNPYTGVSAIFMSRIKSNNRPIINEDGLQSRDFISVHDVVRACIMAMEQKEADFEAFNVGSGKATSIKGVAEIIAKEYGAKIAPEITNKSRKGDLRHCTADISKIKALLGFEPRISFEQGIRELIEWSRKQESVDNFEKADRELKDKGLM
jgi:dTDP-L-rhamnose 4-epimerase